MSTGSHIVKFLGFVCVALTLGACGKTPSGIIKPDKMARLMADIHIGEAVVEQNSAQFKTDSMKQILKQSIYEHNGVTVSEVDKSLAWYGRHTDLFAEVYVKTEELLREDLERVNENAANNLELREVVGFVAEGDSVDIWQQYRQRAFNRSMGSDRVAFEIRSDRYWEAGDFFKLSYKMINARHPYDATIAVDYTDGTTTYSQTSPSGDGWQSVAIQLDPQKSATVVYGVIAYPIDSLADRFPTVSTLVDSISLVRMRKGKQPGAAPMQRTIKSRN